MQQFYYKSPVCVLIIRRGFLYFIFFLVAGCSSHNNSKVIELYKQLGMVFNTPSTVTYQTAKQIPLANVIVQQKAKKTIAVLAYAPGPERQWVTVGREMVVTQRGIVKRTFGLDDNLHDLKYTVGFNPFKQSLAQIKRPQNSQGFLSLMPQKLYDIPFRATFVAMGPRTIDTAYGRKHCIQIKQEVDVPELKWHYSNDYWVTPKGGRVLKSVQHVSPKQAPLVIEVVKAFTKDLD